MEHDLEECVKRLHVEPGDVLVLRTKDRISDEIAMSLKATMRDLFPNNRTAVLEMGLTLEVVTP